MISDLTFAAPPVTRNPKGRRRTVRARSRRRGRSSRARGGSVGAQQNGDNFEIAVLGLFGRMGIPVYDHKDWRLLTEKPELAMVRQYRFPTPLGYGRIDAVLFLPRSEPVGFEFKTQTAGGSTDVKLRELPFRCAIMPWSRSVVVYDLPGVNKKLIQEVVAGIEKSDGLRSHIISNTITNKGWRRKLLANVDAKKCRMLTRRKLRAWIQENVVPILVAEGYVSTQRAHEWTPEVDDAPQIGSLDTLLEVARAMDGKVARVADMGVLLDKPDLNSGMASHYRASVVLAGLVTASPDGTCAMTPEGRAILEAPTSEARVKHWRNLCLSLPMPQRVLAWAEESARTRADLADYFYAELGLSRSNAATRVSAILSWLRSAGLITVSGAGILTPA